MTTELKYLYAKDAVFRCVAQFAQVVENEQEELCFHNLCESALERSFTVLGIDDDIITQSEFYKMWDENNSKLKELGEYVPEFSHYEMFMENRDELLKTHRNYMDLFMEDDK